MFGDEYIRTLGLATAREAQMGLCALLFQRYFTVMDKDGKADAENRAAAIAAAITNYVFAQPPANEYQRNNKDRIENEARKIATEEPLCKVLSEAGYNFCYSQYVERGGSRGPWSNHFLTFIRALSKDDSYASVRENAARKVAGFGQEILAPILTMVSLGIFRPLPYGPNEKQFYEDVHGFAIANGVRFR